MDELVFKIIFLILFVFGILIRVPYAQRYKKTEIVSSQSSNREKFLFALTALGFAGFPLIYLSTPWLDLFRMNVPEWARITGAVIYLLALISLWWIHKILGENWSPLLEIRKNHTLIVVGPYRLIRHPMYTAFYLLVIGQGILLSNWFIEFAGLLTVSILSLVRIKAEEQMMIEAFGDEYKAYMQRTGRLIPKIWK